MELKGDVILFLDREIQIVRKFRARRLTLSIRPDRPLRLTANRTTTPHEMLTFLKSNTGWIQKNISKLEALNARYQKPDLKDGCLFPYLGELKYFTFSKTKAAKMSCAIEDGFLIIYLPDSIHPNEDSKFEIQKVLHKFFKKQAEVYLRQRLDSLILLTQLKPLSLKFGRPRTRWGSCNSKKQINLNWKLICHAPQLIDYVIVHELCHLQFLNHSPDFWNLVGEFMPEYKVYEKTLNDEAQLSSFLND